jgi:hypothetical protein
MYQNGAGIGMLVKQFPASGFPGDTAWRLYRVSSG